MEDLQVTPADQALDETLTGAGQEPTPYDKIAEEAAPETPAVPEFIEVRNPITGQLVTKVQRSDEAIASRILEKDEYIAKLHREIAASRQAPVMQQPQQPSPQSMTPEAVRDAELSRLIAEHKGLGFDDSQINALMPTLKATANTVAILFRQEQENSRRIEDAVQRALGQSQHMVDRQQFVALSAQDPDWAAEVQQRDSIAWMIALSHPDAGPLEHYTMWKQHRSPAAPSHQPTDIDRLRGQAAQRVDQMRSPAAPSGSPPMARDNPYVSEGYNNWVNYYRSEHGTEPPREKAQAMLQHLRSRYNGGTR